MCSRDGLKSVSALPSSEQFKQLGMRFRIALSLYHLLLYCLWESQQMLYNECCVIILSCNKLNLVWDLLSAYIMSEFRL